MWQIRASKLAFTRLNSRPGPVVPAPARGRGPGTVGGPSYGVVMAEESTTRRLRVVRERGDVDVTAETPASVADDLARDAYWARLGELRTERARLLAG